MNCQLIAAVYHLYLLMLSRVSDYWTSHKAGQTKEITLFLFFQRRWPNLFYCTLPAFLDLEQGYWINFNGESKSQINKPLRATTKIIPPPPHIGGDYSIRGRYRSLSFTFYKMLRLILHFFAVCHFTYQIAIGFLYF